MFFERPLAFLLLLLALPWMFWLRHQTPRNYPVGGLEPFRPFVREGGTRRRGWPLALICALSALACATLIWARPSFDLPSRYLLLDQSLSVRSFGLLAPEARGRVVLKCETGLLRILQTLPGRARIEVWTDLPAPAELPDRIRWNDEAFKSRALPNAAILVARPVGEQRWLVHWLAEPGAGPLFLATDTGERLELPAGEEGMTEIKVSAAATRLEIRRRDGSAPDNRIDQDWSLAAGGWTIPQQWDERWETVTAAAWPGFRIQRAVRVDHPPFPADPLAALSDLEAVALLAAHLRGVADQNQPPRPASECRAAVAGDRWSAAAVESAVGANPASSWLGGIGAGFLLLSLLLCVLP